MDMSSYSNWISSLLICKLRRVLFQKKKTCFPGLFPFDVKSKIKSGRTLRNVYFVYTIKGNVKFRNL